MNRSQLFEMPKIDHEKSNIVRKLIEGIEGKLYNGKSVENELKQINELSTSHSYEYNASDFQEFWASKSDDELIREILSPEPPEIDNLTLLEIKKVLQNIVAGDLANQNYFLTLLSKNTSYKYDVSTLLFHPGEFGYPSVLSLEEMANIIFANEAPPNPPRIFFL